MNTAVFSAVKALAIDYQRLWIAIRAADKSMEAITSAASDRIKADRQAAAERVDILTRQSADPARPEIVRRLALQELEQLQVRTYGASEDEAAAFAAEMQNALDALDGARETGSKLSAALKAAAAEVDKIRAECNGFGDLGLVQNWLDGDQRRFDALGKTGQPGGKS